MAALSAATVATKAYSDSSDIVASSGGPAAVRPYPQRHSNALPQALDLIRQRNVPLSRHAQTDLRLPVGERLAQRPHTPVREVEQHRQPQHHQRAGDPDDVDAGVLDHFQARETGLSNEVDVQIADRFGRSL